MELQFEHIDWNDIVEAEESGDAESLQHLRLKSLHLKKQQYSPEYRLPFSQLDGNTIMMSTRESRQVVSPVPRARTPQGGDTPTNVFSYARAVQPLQGVHSSTSRNLKRSASEWLSPPPRQQPVKRTTVRKCTPSPSNQAWRNHLTATTPQEEIDPSAVESVTPETEKLTKNLTQRRLFGLGGLTDQQQLDESPGEKQALTPHRIAQRQKQIDMGKNTNGYRAYVKLVPRLQREKGDPMTPNKYKPCSTRSWQGQIRVWRCALHKYDPPEHQLFTPEDAMLCDM